MARLQMDTGKHYLLPSTLFMKEDPFIVDTVLGSCISVCLFDKHLQIGGINHFMLPFWNGNGLASPKYGNIANERLLNLMLSRGSNRNNMIAKIFGGANQMSSSLSVGERNAQVAIDFLSNEGIKLVAKSIGGDKGRKISYNTQTGEVLMKFLRNDSSRTPIEKHQESNKLNRKAI